MFMEPKIQMRDARHYNGSLVAPARECSPQRQCSLVSTYLDDDEQVQCLRQTDVHIQIQVP